MAWQLKFQIVKALADASADVSIEDSDGNTAEALADKSKEKEIALFLKVRTNRMKCQHVQLSFLCASASQEQKALASNGNINEVESH